MIELDIQRLCEGPEIPDDRRLASWVDHVLSGQGDLLVNLRLVDEVEGRALNWRWRGIDRATNVLSFPASAPPAGGVRVLGDVVLCGPVVAREAREQGKTVEDHWAHLVAHGLLHLLGYDHINPAEAVEMEDRETRLLAGLGIANPYAVHDET
ncbi:MAG: rRNA maturation RNase YbeY [Gammaproteobacteria bacterium]|jgi:probable rRNA maturation factor|nr:rRNA maturation RNase YbeY [Gammaproteobacteria bacterium]